MFLGFTGWFARLAEYLLAERAPAAGVIVKAEFLDEVALAEALEARGAATDLSPEEAILAAAADGTPELAHGGPRGQVPGRVTHDVEAVALVVRVECVDLDSPSALPARGRWASIA